MLRPKIGITEVVVKMTVELTEEQDEELYYQFMERNGAIVPGCKYPILMTSLERFTRIPGYVEGPKRYQLMANIVGVIVDRKVLEFLEGDNP